MGIETKKVEKQKTSQPEMVTIRDAIVCDGCGFRDEGREFVLGGRGGTVRYKDFDIEWIPITVEAGESGEEGWEKVENWYCGECSRDVLDALVLLGFASHHHGSTNNLENDSCVGYVHTDECPTPSSPYDESDW